MHLVVLGGWTGRAAAGSVRAPARLTTKFRRSTGVLAQQGTEAFLLGDVLIFGVFFATFMVQRSKDPAFFDAAWATELDGSAARDGSRCELPSRPTASRCGAGSVGGSVPT